jgi:retinol dehydrogenase 12
MTTDKPLDGRIALITGANTGIGRVTARELARRGARVFVATRSEDRARGVLDDIRTAGGEGRWLALDLGDLDSVRRCAQAFLALDAPLHLLINNAGLAAQRGLTRSGFELAFGTNHVGHFLLTQLLTERLRQSAPARVVTVASRAHYRAKGIDWEAVRRPTAHRFALPEYCVSKLANVLFSAELARRLAGSGVSTYALHPGVVASDIWRPFPRPLRWLVTRRMLTTEQGALTTLHCATADAVSNETGLYYDDCRARTPSALARDAGLALDLWRRSEQWVQHVTGEQHA